MNHPDFFFMLRRFRWLYLAVFFVASGIGGYFMIPYVLEYEGDSTFYLANESMVNPSLFSQSNQADILQVNLVQERVYQLAYSNEMMLFLIGRYNLYEHYDIDTTHRYHFEKAVRKLTRKIRFRKITSDLSGVTVIDRNNEMAATLSNAIVWKLDQLNKKYLSDKIQANLTFYDSFLKEATRTTVEQNAILKNAIDNLSSIRHQAGNGNNMAQPLSEVEFSLFQAASEIQDITTQLSVARNMYSTALSNQQHKNLPSLVVVKKALPDVKSKKPMLAGLAALGGALSVALLILIMYFIMTYKRELTIIFGVGPVDESITGK